MNNCVQFYDHLLPKVTTVGRHEVKESWVHSPRFVNINTMIYVIEGTVYISEDEYSYEISKDQVFFLKSGCRQTGTKPIISGTNWYWVSFETNHNDMLQSNYPYNILELPKIVQCSCFDKIYSTLSHMEGLYVSDIPYKSQLLDGYLHQIFYELLNLGKSETDEMTSRSIAPKVIRLLNNTLGNKLSADYISNTLGMNYSYISRQFKKETGIPISQYYMKIKVNQAINLFYTTNMNISEISDKLGYPNPYYFSRVFKKVIGMSPTEYKQHMY